LVVWFPTTKSQESTRFPCVQVTCDIPLKSSWQGLQLCFRPHLNQRFACKVMGPQSWRSPNFDNFGTLGTKCYLDVSLAERHIYTIRGKVLVSPKSRPWWVLWIQVCPWLVLAPKVFQLCTNHLVLVWYKFVWVVDACHSS